MHVVVGLVSRFFVFFSLWTIFADIFARGYIVSLLYALVMVITCHFSFFFVLFLVADTCTVYISRGLVFAACLCDA